MIRLTSVAAATVLGASTLSAVAMTDAPVLAACAPSTSVTPVAKATKKVAISRSMTVRKVGRNYVAVIRVTATQGRASVVIRQTVCPDGPAGDAASTTQSATGVGRLVRTVSARRASKTDAKRAARAKATEVAKRIRRVGGTRRGRASAQRRAVTVARTAALQRADRALHDATIVYLDTTTGTVTSTPSAGGPTLVGAGGDLVLTVPAAEAPLTSLACLRPAPAWPSQVRFDAGAVTSAELTAHAASIPSVIWLDAYQFSNLSAGAPALTSERAFTAGFRPTNDVVLGSGDAAAPPAELICFVYFRNVTSTPRTTVTIHRPVVGTVLGPVLESALRRVTDGVPITVH